MAGGTRSINELYNRRYFQDASQRTIANQAKGAVLLLDLDQFKEINELSGHHVGDRLLREVADTLFLNLSQRNIIAASVVMNLPCCWKILAVNSN